MLHMALQERVSSNIRMIAAASGTTPTDTARKAGMPVSLLHGKLQGRVRWNVEDLELIAVALDVTPAQLVTDHRAALGLGVKSGGSSRLLPVAVAA